MPIRAWGKGVQPSAPIAGSAPSRAVKGRGGRERGALPNGNRNHPQVGSVKWGRSPRPSRRRGKPAKVSVGPKLGARPAGRCWRVSRALTVAITVKAKRRPNELERMRPRPEGRLAGLRAGVVKAHSIRWVYMH